MSRFQHQEQQIKHNMQMGSGLTRYKSAPSSYFDSFLNGDDDLDQLLNPRICSPETQRILSRFINSDDTNNNNNSVQENCSPNLNLQSQSQLNRQPLVPKKDDDGGDEPEVKRPRQQLQRQQSHDFSSVSQVNCDIKSSIDGLAGSIDTNRVAQVKIESYSLVRHSSSPAGLFDNINIEEFGGMRGIGKIGARNAGTSFSSASRFKSNKTDLPPRNPSSSSKMGPVSGNKPVHDRGSDIPGFPLNPWDDSIMSDDFLRALTEDVDKSFARADALDDQKNEGGNRSTTRLSHHLSLPSNSYETEKLLQDSVPCKLRAKRGFATHPRSIAERVRRTKISDRIRKLEELVPNMERQTNTADMLDFAVDYIKDLQRQIEHFQVIKQSADARRETNLYRKQIDAYLARVENASSGNKRSRLTAEEAPYINLAWMGSEAPWRLRFDDVDMVGDGRERRIWRWASGAGLLSRRGRASV
ncbi:hypothetical protein CASFOL_035331 [Castilleja foliolosa]|uniref:BHLH domain-containing protein n=1 Tax=Castilleja foliolosa TaxID=1961234 RepID=A0ABD3BT96_9LAMI